jgi:putative ABC transport system permease protein
MLDIKLLWRDWRGGQLNLIVSALTLAVMVVTAVSVLADRVERGLEEQITSFLAADLAVQSSLVMDNSFRLKAQEIGLNTAQVAFFSSMVFSETSNHLASVKVVETNYPLRGQIEVSHKDSTQPPELLSQGPDKGEAWVEARLLNLLDLSLGDNVEVGYSSLRITRIIINEPDRGTGFNSAGARIMMSDLDLTESQLVRPGSRITYRLLMSGADPKVKKYQQWYQDSDEAQPESFSHYRLRTPENAEEQLSEALERGRSFLLLSGTIGVLLAGLAMALASQRYAIRLTDQVALMKAWGQSARRIRRSQLVRLIVITSIASILGMLLGWLAHFILLTAAEGIFEATLPAPGVRPFIVAAVTGFISVMGFALPALWHLPTIAPLKVLRRDLPDSLVSQSKRLLVGISALLLLTYWYSGSLLMSMMFLGTLFALFGICAFIALQALKLVQGFGSWQGSFVRLGLANLWRRRNQTMVQLIGFSVTLMLLLVTTGMRTNLVAEWQAQLPEDSPTHFLFNVSSSELEPLKSLLQEENVSAERWYPMVRGRLVSLNSEPLTVERLRQTDGLGREVNFTQSANLPPSNAITSGKWWDGQITNNAIAEFSMEQEVAEELGVAIGDVIGFSIGGITFDAELTSIRSVDWQSMNANFYIIFSPGMLDRFSPNWLTAIRATEKTQQVGQNTQEHAFVSKLIKNYPAAVVLELSQVVERIRDIINRVTLGLEMILLLVLACGALVLFAAIGVSYDERLRESAVLRTLGSSRKIVAGGLAIEFAVLGAIAGIIASAGAELMLYLIQTKVFDMAASWHFALWGLGIVGGVVIITTLGLLRSRKIITVPPLQSLRQIT